MYKEKLRELALFSPQERWLRGDLFVVFCFTKGGYREDRADSSDTWTAMYKLWSQFSAREIANGQKEKSVLQQDWLATAEVRLRNICPQRYPKLNLRSPMNLNYEGSSA